MVKEIVVWYRVPGRSSVDNSVVAVQVADGNFVPVLNTSSKTRKRLVVTTVRDNQTDVQIELYRGSDESMQDAQYVGSLVIKNIEAAPAGEADVTVLTGVDDSGNLNVTATNTANGEYQSLSVSLEDLSAEGPMAMPDFAIAQEDDDSLDEISLDEVAFDEVSDDEAPRTVPESLLTDDEEEFSLDELSLDDEGDEDLDPVVAETSDPAETDDDADIFADFTDDAVALDESLTEDEDESEPEAEVAALDDDEFAALSEPASEQGSESADDFSFDDELTLDDDLSFDEDKGADEPILAEANIEEQDLSKENFSFEESSGDDDELSLDDDLSFDELGTPDESAPAEEEFQLDDDFQFEESAEEPILAQEGLEQQDLGDEDFTFDESTDDEPLFGDPTDIEDDTTPSPAAELHSHQDDLDDTLSREEFEQMDADPIAAGPEPPPEAELEPRKSNGIIFVGYLVLALAALGVLTYLVFRLLEGPPAPPLRATLRAVMLGFPLVRSKRTKK
jgi:hypothetical protein